MENYVVTYSQELNCSGETLADAISDALAQLGLPDTEEHRDWCTARKL